MLKGSWSFPVWAIYNVRLCFDEASVADIQVRRLETFDAREIAGLTDILMDCVEGGASVSFMWPLARAKAEAFWHDAANSAKNGERVILAAEDASGTMVGTVSVVWAKPENQPHRADIAKMLVHRKARDRGVGAALLRSRTSRRCRRKNATCTRHCEGRSRSPALRARRLANERRNSRLRFVAGRTTFGRNRVLQKNLRAQTIKNRGADAPRRKVSSRSKGP